MNEGRALMISLWKVWEKTPPTTNPSGDRLFFRMVDLDDGDMGYVDWTLCALVRPNGKVKWLSEHGPVPAIERAIQKGKVFGSFRLEKQYIQWCRSSGDGPPEDRVSDWCSSRE